MQDHDIIAMYFARDEHAADETYRKFGSYCYTIAYNILGCEEDAQECVNDVLARLWDSIPPARPENLYAYIAATARNLARNRYAHDHRLRRGGSELPVIYDELRDCSTAPDTVEQQVDARRLTELLNEFLSTLNPEHRKIFLQRYWYCCPVEDIAANLHITRSKVTVTLMRTRKKLSEFLQKEGFQ